MQRRVRIKTTQATGTTMAMIVRDVLLLPAAIRTLSPWIKSNKYKVKVTANSSLTAI